MCSCVHIPACVGLDRCACASMCPRVCTCARGCICPQCACMCEAASVAGSAGRVLGLRLTPCAAAQASGRLWGRAGPGEGAPPDLGSSRAPRSLSCGASAGCPWPCLCVGSPRLWRESPAGGTRGRATLRGRSSPRHRRSRRGRGALPEGRGRLPCRPAAFAWPSVCPDSAWAAAAWPAAQRLPPPPPPPLSASAGVRAPCPAPVGPGGGGDRARVGQSSPAEGWGRQEFPPTDLARRWEVSPHHSLLEGPGNPPAALSPPAPRPLVRTTRSASTPTP